MSYFFSYGAPSATETEASYLFPTVGFTTLIGSGFGAIRAVYTNLTCNITPAPGVGSGWNICLRRATAGTCGALGFGIYNTTTNATDNIYIERTIGVVANWAIMFQPVNKPLPITRAACGMEVRYVPAFTP